MKQRDLDSMSIEELWMLHERIAATLTAKINAEKKALMDRLKQAGVMALSIGIRSRSILQHPHPIHG